MMKNEEMIKRFGSTKAVEAEYKEQELDDYKGNPLIEALPPILSGKEAYHQIKVRPPFSAKERELDAHLRLHCIERLFRFRQPLNRHFDIEQKFSRIIRQGYLHRNPLKPEVVAKLRSMGKLPDLTQDYDYDTNSTASGFAIIGVSGVGKTTAVERILSLYPQIIVHSEYKGCHLSMYQLPYLKLECPNDGSIKALCTNFFDGVDKLLNTDYFKKFGATRQSTTDFMIPKMAQVSNLHSIGVLVIDEIQHLSTAKSGGAARMLNFFVNLVNTIGIPVVLIGTPLAESILSAEFRQGRRGSGQGAVVWDRMVADTKEWNLLLEGMWKYQWTKNKIALNDELNKLIYEESQGIVDIAVKLYAMAQVRAIVTNTETITPDIIKDVVEDSFQLIKPALDALKSGNPNKIKEHSDISSSLEFDQYMKNNMSYIDKSKVIAEFLHEEEKEENDDITPIFDQLLNILMELGVDPKITGNAAEKAIINLGNDAELVSLQREAIKIAFELEKEKEAEKKPEKDKNNGKNKTKDARDLRLISEQAKKEKVSTYSHLKEAGYIKNPIDEFGMES